MFKEELKGVLELKLPKRSALQFSTWLTYLCLILIIYLIVDFFWLHLFFNNQGNHTGSDLGTFGDFIGGIIGTIVSLITVILVWLTYHSQKEELTELRKQAKEQVEIQALSALIVHYHNEIKTLQDFLDEVIYAECSPVYITGTLAPKRARLEYYLHLSVISEELLTSKVKSLAAYRYILTKGEESTKKEENDSEKEIKSEN